MEALYDCRICLESKPNLTSLYEIDRDKQKYLPAVIYNISGVKILRNVEPFAKICFDCKTEILIAENIILRCQETEEFFQYERLAVAKCETRKNYESCTEQEETIKCSNLENQSVQLHMETNDSSDDDEFLYDAEDFEQNRAKKQTEIPIQEKPLLKCEICEFSTEKPKDLVLHRSNVHQLYDPKIYTCKICYERFSKTHILYRHMENFHKVLPEEKKYLCNECGKAYINERHLKEHYKERHEPKRFKCVAANCQQSFSRAFTLRRHFSTAHENNAKLHCEECNKNFKVYDHWKYHNKTVHNNQKRLESQITPKK